MNDDQATIADVRHGTAAVNGTRLHYVTAGDQGTPVLLVHGFPETWWAFRTLIPLLAARHRVYAVDLRGFGDSDVADESYSGAVAAEDLHALIEHLAMGPMHVVGQDVSGGVVYRLAATHPEDVISLTAIESGLAGIRRRRTRRRHPRRRLVHRRPGRPRHRRPAVREGGPRLHRGVPVPALRRRPHRSQRRGHHRVRPHLRQARRVLRRRRPLPRHAAGAELRTLAQDAPLRLPVTTIGSRGGGFTHAAFSAVTAQEVTAIQLDGIGHYVAQEAPGLLADVLIKTFAANAP